MDYTKFKGNLTELKCLIGFMSMGFDCSIPYGDNSRYDMIVDVGDELLRVQCKSASNPIKDGKRPSREELKGLLRLKSFVEIGKDYGVSDNAVRRWCKSYNLPTKMSDIKSINPNDWLNL